jgi:hypothetical protein
VAPYRNDAPRCIETVCRLLGPAKRNGMTSFKSAITLIILGGLVAVASCSDSGRPRPDNWAADWEDLTTALPTLDELGDPPDRALCAHALGEIREGQAELLPAPDISLDPVVQEWFTVAEDALFECPPSSNQFPDFAYAYQVLARLEAEVEAALALAGAR